MILTTNLDTSIDPALRRRLASHIVFGTPELAERVKLWAAMLDTGAPLQPHLDLRALAEEFADMTGANIRNATLAAAFLASDEGSAIGLAHLRRAATGSMTAKNCMAYPNPKRYVRQRSMPSLTARVRSNWIFARSSRTKAPTFTGQPVGIS